MRIEIPATATKAGKIQPILVQIDDVIAEMQPVTIIEI